jgi:hypothetical protein
MDSSTANSVGFEIFTSLRLDPILRKSLENSALSDGRESPLYMPSHHQSRLLEAAEAFGFNCTECLELVKDGARFETYITSEAERWESSEEGRDSSNGLRVLFI